MLEDIFHRVKLASKSLPNMDEALRNRLLCLVADAIEKETETLLAANREDLAAIDKSNPMYDRLQLTPARLKEIADNMRHVATLPSPLGKVLKHKTLPNGLDLRRVSVPFGVIGVVYEARPNVTFDVFALCLKSGNASILKCGKDAFRSCQAGVDLIHRVLESVHVCPDIVALLPATHEATAALLQAVGYVDLCIPRGGKRLISFVRDTAKVPVIETGAGVVHCYFDKRGNVAMGQRIIDNAKTRRCSVCNTLDCLIIHSSRLSDLPQLVKPLADKQVKLHADPRAYAALQGRYPADLLIKTVDSIDEALEHIDTYGSGHSESIVTDDRAAARHFQQAVDAACVYVNAPTSFTDGAQFGLGAEIGISTQKLGARGPMALEEMTTYKWLINGNGQVRP